MGTPTNSHPRLRRALIVTTVVGRNTHRRSGSALRWRRPSMTSRRHDIAPPSVFPRMGMAMSSNAPTT